MICLSQARTAAQAAASAAEARTAEAEKVAAEARQKLEASESRYVRGVVVQCCFLWWDEYSLDCFML